jgi:hypothetical protein
MNTQAERLLDWLQAGNKVTRLTALVELGIFELSARVIDLEAKGYVIDRKRIRVTNRFGEVANVAEYWLSCNARHPCLG